MADDDTFVVGAPLPRIAAAEARDGMRIVVTWASDGPGAAVQVVDLAPAVFRYKLYAPLRDDPALFGTVRVVDDGFALAWGDGDDLDMASTTLAELAQQAMTPADFAAFMKRNGYTLDSVAAELGISRRLAAYYAKDREIPRTVALACRYLDKGGASGIVTGAVFHNGVAVGGLAERTALIGAGVGVIPNVYMPGADPVAVRGLASLSVADKSVADKGVGELEAAAAAIAAAALAGQRSRGR